MVCISCSKFMHKRELVYAFFVASKIPKLWNFARCSTCEFKVRAVNCFDRFFPLFCDVLPTELAVVKAYVFSIRYNKCVRNCFNAPFGERSVLLCIYNIIATFSCKFAIAKSYVRNIDIKIATDEVCPVAFK